MQFRYHCFISYTTREREVQRIKPIIDRYCDTLKSRGVRVCPAYYDGWYLERHRYDPDELARLLRDAIANSAFTVSFLSPSYLWSHWCRFEWATTQDVHSRRPSPAPAKSILPLCWKRLAFYDFFHPPSLYYNVMRRPLVRAFPFGYPTLGRCVDATLGYLNAWYPNGWLEQPRHRVRRYLP
jgi:hypothetical protein